MFWPQPERTLDEQRLKHLGHDSVVGVPKCAQELLMKTLLIFSASLSL